jgi:phosphoserine phosphatase
MKDIHLFLLLTVLFSCKESVPATENTKAEITEVLPSWKDGESKKSIINFVESITDPQKVDFVPAADRIATFDNDGTLWSEQPIYFQVAFAMDAAKKMVAKNPEMKKDAIFNALANNDMDAVLEAGAAGLGKILVVTHTGMNTDEFNKSVGEWVKTATHPKTGKLYKEMIFQPMLEVINYLKANEFSVYIVSGGGTDFMRPWAEDVYGIRRDNIIGSTYALEYVMENDEPVLKILPEVGFNDDKEGKPMAIHQYIGRKPIVAFGNSDGDLQMLKWTDSNSHPSLQVYVRHTDEAREWKYDRESHIGQLDKGLDEAEAKGWTIVDMKNDWEVIYPYEMKNP